MKFNIITHITTACNFDCSYCDVIKDKRLMKTDVFSSVVNFIENNDEYIERFKFFGGEPLLAKTQIKALVKKFPHKNNFEIVTNTTLLDDEIGQIFEKQFTLIFFSIDSENSFDFDKNLGFISQYDLENKLYFNIIIDPENIKKAEEQFFLLYKSGMRGYNFLPVYFTKAWNENQLKDLSIFMKKVLDITSQDDTLRLYGFQENKGYDASLINPSIFIDIDGKIYYSDFVSTFQGSKIKDDLYLGTIDNFSLEKLIDFNFESHKKALRGLEEKINLAVKGQKQLHKIMDYFSEYLNKKNGK